MTEAQDAEWRKAIGSRVAALREITGLSRCEFAQRIGQSASWVDRLEAGTVALTMRRFVAICTALECSPSELLG